MDRESWHSVRNQAMRMFYFKVTKVHSTTTAWLKMRQCATRVRMSIPAGTSFRWATKMWITLNLSALSPGQIGGAKAECRHREVEPHSRRASAHSMGDGDQSMVCGSSPHHQGSSREGQRQGDCSPGLLICRRHSGCGFSGAGISLQPRRAGLSDPQCTPRSRVAAFYPQTLHPTYDRKMDKYSVTECNSCRRWRNEHEEGFTFVSHTLHFLF